MAILSRNHHPEEISAVTQQAFEGIDSANFAFGEGGT
jgi:hypothetical protein